ncbi:MAG: Maf family protein [bacterium]
MSDPLNILRGQKLVLASASPRRKELLERAGLDLEIYPVDIDEIAYDEEPGLDYVSRIAFEKYVEAQRKLGSDKLILTADTCVILNQQILGKPEDQHHAEHMLSQLSGQEHQVITSLCLGRGETWQQKYSVAKVSFMRLSLAEIRAYIATGEPMDKAGSYGIQGLGGLFVKNIRGNHSAIMGLDLNMFYQLVKKF